MTRAITADGLWALARVGYPEPIPDGGGAVVPVTTFDDDHVAGRTRLWLVTAGGSRTPLTRSERTVSKPAVSPDGTRLAFLSKEPKGEDPAQVHVMRLGGGEAEEVASLPLGARAVRWHPTGNELILAAPLFRDHPTIEASAAEREARKDGKPRPVVTEDRVYRFWKRWLAGDTLDHLFRIDLAASEPIHLTPWLDRIIALEDPEAAFDISPDGASIAVAIDVSEPAWDRALFAIHLLDTEGGTVTRLGERSGQQRSPRFSPDGSSLIYGWQENPNFYADRVRLVLHDLAGGSEAIITEGWDRSPSEWRFAADGRIVLTAEDRGHLRIWSTTADGPPQALTSDGSCHGGRPAGGAVWHLSESSTQPPDVAVTTESGTRAVGGFNDEALSDIRLGRFEEIEIAGGDGEPVQVQITYPPGFEPGAKWPLLHNVHGGPHNASLDQWHWRWNTQVLAAAGYVVASVNFHGSSSWGQAFAESIRGAFGDLPTADVIAATDHLVGLGFIDESRMAIAGGSYGGYLAAWITGRTDRFRCSVVHAGVTDLVGQWASDLTAGREEAVGGVPWENLDAVEAWSPTANMADVTTPTLVIHGELDYRVVVTQGLLWYGMLKAKGVPARLVYFRDEGHWIEQRHNALLWWGEVLGWLTRWVGSDTTSKG
jgi:dipeptidyl aminopeptidase/acylaminoacyl peptidase